MTDDDEYQRARQAMRTQYCVTRGITEYQLDHDPEHTKGYAEWLSSELYFQATNVTILRASMSAGLDVMIHASSQVTERIAAAMHDANAREHAAKQGKPNTHLN